MFDKGNLERISQARKAWEESLPSKEKGKEFTTASGIPAKPIYTSEDLAGWDYVDQLGFPGHYPFTRGMMPGGYRDQLWVMNQYAGFGTPESTNEWFRYLLSQGATGLSIAWDLPTQIGLDSDHFMARGEVGRQGVSISSLADMEILLEGIPLERIRLATTANAIGPIYLAWLLAILGKRGIDPHEMRLSIQNDVLKEFFARGTWIFPPKPSLKFSNDVVEYCVRNGLKNAQALSVCGYHIRETGVKAFQETAFLLADAIAYIEELIERGLSIDDFGRHINLFPGTAMDLFEEIAKLRSLRRMWAKLLKERFGAKNPEVMKVWLVGFTQGSYLTAQQPLNNIVRATIMALASVLGGVSSLTVSSYDEARALPSDEAVRIALRTQQIIAYESGVVNTIDPLGGSYYVESLTDELEKRTNDILSKIQEMGGAIAAIEEGYFDREIAKAAYEYLRTVNTGEKVVVGVNKYVIDEPLSIKVRVINPEEEKRQIEKLGRLKRERDNSQVEAALARLREAARANVNLVEPLLDTVKTYATLGEIRDTLVSIWGEYKSVGL